MIITLTLARSTLNTFRVSEVYVCQYKSFHSFVLLQLFNSIYETTLRKTEVFEIDQLAAVIGGAE